MRKREMNQCVPNWDEDPPNPPPHHLSFSSARHVPTSDSEVAELTWENGHLVIHGLGHPRISKPVPTYPHATAAAALDKPRASGTLEAVVDQASRALLLTSSSAAAAAPHRELAPRISKPLHRRAPAPPSDALVPCSSHQNRRNYLAPEIGTCMASSSGGDSGRKRARVGEGRWNCGYQRSGRSGESTQVSDTCEMIDIDDADFTTTSASQSPEEGGGSPDTENTSFGGHDSTSHSSRSQRDGAGDEVEKVTKGETGTSSISTKRSRAAAIHNHSERKRRDRINQKIRTLQKLVPNSSKANKASMLDEVIQYLKQLQAQVQMMSRMSSIRTMMMPMGVQQLQMLIMAQMAHMSQLSQMGMSLSMMDLGSLGQHGFAGLPPVIPASVFHPIVGASWDGSTDRTQQPGGGGSVLPDPFPAFLAGPVQPMSMDAYSRVVALYQQQYQPTPPVNRRT